MSLGDLDFDCRRVGRSARRPVVVVSLILAVLFASVAAQAQHTGKVYRIGVLRSIEAPHLWDPFRQVLREFGYVEGQNIVIEWRSVMGRPERIPDFAAELVRLKVDVIVAGGGSTMAHAARRLTATIPIVMISGDPVADGLVASLGRPGGNVTGISTLATGVVGKQLELLKEVVPRLSRVAILWNPDNPSHAAHVREAEAMAQKLQLHPRRVEARRLEELDGAFAAMAKVRAEAFLLLADAPVFLQQRAVIADLAAKRRLPAMYPRRDHVEAGGLIAYGADRRELLRRLAMYVDKILKGAKPADLPVEQPTKFELVINLKAAKALGLTIPPSVLSRADQIVK
jgi:putative ABC transport system substrate-binding protein